jgi:hypothetical protein
MREVMYDQSSVLIVWILFVSLIGVIEAGYRVGHRAQAHASESSTAHINAIQAAVLGILALLLGFTFSLSLQRFESRSEAVVDEANAIGTAYLRAQLLPSSVRHEVRQSLRDYLDLRVQASMMTVGHQAERQALLVRANQVLDSLWLSARQAAEENASPVTSGLFIQSLNDLIDSYGRRDAALNRHVPEVVLWLLYGVLLMTGSIIGYACGVAGHRASLVAYIMVVLIVFLVFIIIDLDRPHRGLITVSQKSLIDLQTTIATDQRSDAQPSSSVDVPPPAGTGRR